MPSSYATEKHAVTSGTHECNWYCRDDIHAHTMRSMQPLEPEIVAVITTGGQRHEIDSDGYQPYRSRA